MKKSKILLNYNEQKELFEKFSLDTLDSLAALYEIAGKDSPDSFAVVFDYKFENYDGSFEGITEYPYTRMVDKLSVQEIIDKLDELSDPEMDYTAKIILNAISNIDPREEEIKLIPRLTEFQKAYCTEKIRRLEPLDNGMTLDDVKRFFNKYNRDELEKFGIILELSSHERIKDITRIKNEVLNEKVKTDPNDFEQSFDRVRINPLHLTDLSRKDIELKDIEFDFFHSLVEDAAMHTECLKKYRDYYEENIKEFKLCNYPIYEMPALLNKINIDKEARILDKAPSNQKTI